MTILITTIGVVFTYYGTNYAIKKRVTSAKEERVNRAKDKILQIFERKLVDDMEIQPQQIHQLISAVERSNSVRLSNEVTPISLLEDLQLRIEESHHLAQDQKREYINRIQSIISEVHERKQNSKLSGEVQEDIERLAQKLEEGNIDADNELSVIKAQLAELEDLNEYIRAQQTSISKVREAISLATALLTGLSVFYLFNAEQFNIPSLELPFLSTALIIIGSAIIASIMWILSDYEV